MKTVLIIDDDPRIVSALEVRLRAGGYTTFATGDATTGFSRALELRPDLILLDISLPAGDGLSLAQKLRHRAETRSTPIIFVTAHLDPELRERTMEVGAAGLFEKPYDGEELMAVIGHALGETGMFRRRIAQFVRDAAEATAVEPAVTSPPVEPFPCLKRILIIEDDAKIAMALALRLKTAGYETTLAHDALAGVNLALRMKPDLVLLDVSLPAGDGFQVAERMRALQAAPAPIIFLTASQQPGLRERARSFDAGFFEKPYEHEALLAAVEQRIGV